MNTKILFAAILGCCIHHRAIMQISTVAFAQYMGNVGSAKEKQVLTH